MMLNGVTLLIQFAHGRTTSEFYKSLKVDLKSGQSELGGQPSDFGFFFRLFPPRCSLFTVRDQTSFIPFFICHSLKEIALFRLHQTNKGGN